ncbi:hypothetical protein PENSPDRAFT_614856 [Peniophora sp. CONT]|nr:hypothetical protein PENSPDRAFT_614856 [Peniophora sp. CONT]
MQSNTLLAFDDAHWDPRLEDGDWLSGSPTNDPDFDEFMDFDPVLGDAQAFPTSGFGASDALKQVDTATSPRAELEPSSICVSTVFNFDRVDPGGSAPDIDLVASDGVHFAVNAAKLRANSLNGFDGLLLPTSTTAAVPLSSKVLNMLLHTIYGLSAREYAPTVDELTATIDASERYGLSVEALAHNPTSPLYEAILFRAPSQPLECYSLAAHAKLDELAIAVSSYTLSVHLPDITEETAEHMGARYLRRLFFLHLGRMEALKRILRTPFIPHSPTEDCDGSKEYPPHDEWVKRAAEIVWNASPNISPISLETRLSDIAKADCTECQYHLEHRIKRLITEWSLVKNTI